MNKVNIYIVAHKPCDLPHDGVMRPIHVGRAVSQWKEEMAWMIGVQLQGHMFDMGNFNAYRNCVKDFTKK